MQKYLWRPMAALAVGLALAALYATSASGSEVRQLKTAFRHLPPAMNLCCYLARVAEENHGNIGLPLSDRDAQSLLFGPVREIVSELGKRLGLSFEWHLKSFSRSLEELASGELDVLPYLFVTKERGEYLWFAGPLEAEDRAVYFLLNKEHHGDITKFADLYGLKLANEKSTLTAAVIDENPDIIIQRYASREAALEAVVNGHADALIDSNFHRIAELSKKKRSEELTLSSYKYEFVRPTFIGLSKSRFSEAEAIKIDLAIEKMFEDGTMTLMYKGAGLPTPKYHRELSELRPIGGN